MNFTHGQQWEFMLQKKLNAVIALLKLYDIIFVCMCAKLSKFYLIYLKIFFMLGIVYVHVCVGVCVHICVCLCVCMYMPQHTWRYQRTTLWSCFLLSTFIWVVMRCAICMATIFTCWVISLTPKFYLFICCIVLIINSQVLSKYLSCWQYGTDQNEVSLP